MCKALAGLFPDGVAAAELHEPGDVSVLLAAEALHVGAAAPERAREFAAGRECARRALAEFGIDGVPILAGPDRRPLWPVGFTGSITHTRGFAAAVVAEREHFLGLGIDCEVTGEVGEELWPRICVPDEIAWLRSLPGKERGAAATLVFSAKEAYYKCCYPVSGERPGFQDLCIEPGAWGEGRGSFRVRGSRGENPARRAGQPTHGRYLQHGSLTSTGVAWLSQAALDRDDAGGQ